MREVQIIRQAMDVNTLAPIYDYALGQLLAAHAGFIKTGRIYDDLWPLNIGGLYCYGISSSRLERELEKLYPEGWDWNTQMFLYTTHYPYHGNWHRDAPPYEDDLIALLCIDGFDELEYAYQPMPGRYYKADLRPGDLCLLPTATWHRGHCSTHRITWHCRFGPRGKTIPPSPMEYFPPMTITRFIKRTARTLRYYLW